MEVYLVILKKLGLLPMRGANLETLHSCNQQDFLYSSLKIQVAINSHELYLGAVYLEDDSEDDEAREDYLVDDKCSSIF